MAKVTKKTVRKRTNHRPSLSSDAFKILADRMDQMEREMSHRADELVARIERMERSDFTANREDYRKAMLDLRQSNPGVLLFPE